MSSGELAETFHSGELLVNAYHTHTGSCRLSDALSPSWPGCIDSSFAKQCDRITDSHSASGEPEVTIGATLPLNSPRVILCLVVRSRGKSLSLSCLLNLTG